MQLLEGFIRIRSTGNVATWCLYLVRESAIEFSHIPAQRHVHEVIILNINMHVVMQIELQPDLFHLNS